MIRSRDIAPRHCRHANRTFIELDEPILPCSRYAENLAVLSDRSSESHVLDGGKGGAAGDATARVDRDHQSRCCRDTPGDIGREAVTGYDVESDSGQEHYADVLRSRALPREHLEDVDLASDIEVVN